MNLMARENYTYLIYIKFVSGLECIVELKPSYRVSDPKVQAKKNYAIEYCLNKNIKYCIITEIEINMLKTNSVH